MMLIVLYRKCFDAGSDHAPRCWTIERAGSSTAVDETKFVLEGRVNKVQRFFHGT